MSGYTSGNVAMVFFSDGEKLVPCVLPSRILLKPTESQECDSCFTVV